MTLQQSEDSLILLSIERDREAFTALYDRYVDKVYRNVYYQVKNQMDTEDITQEVFLRAWKAINKYKRTEAPFGAWLMAIAHHLITDHYRARKDLDSLDETEVYSQTIESNPETMTEAIINQRHVRNAVLKLKGEKQRVILMRFIEGFSYGEIARALNKSEGSVRVIQYRALKDLRSILTRSE